MRLKGKHILLGITGSIAAYKAATLARLFVKAGADVQVVMTPAAKEFITPLTLSTLTGHSVISEFFNERSGDWNSHVDLGLWADAMVIAPATAATMGKMCYGIADNHLVTTYLSCRAPVFVAPAMDLDMYAHPSTTAALELLQCRGVTVVEPGTGELASHLVGKGRMAEPEEIYEQIAQFLAPTPLPFTGKRVLITSGPTYERIDPVRFIGNFSTGKMGNAIATAFAEAGAEVTVVSGPVQHYPEGDRISVVRVESAEEMKSACLDHADSYDLAIMCAAVADYRPEQLATNKIKREKVGEMTLRLVPNPDIAATLGARKLPHQSIVGFALETDASETDVIDKMRRKSLDMIVLNRLSDPGSGFATDTNKITLFTAKGEKQVYPLKSKTEVARDLLSAILTYGLLSK